MSIKKQLFGKTEDGKEVFLYTLKNKNGMEAGVLNYGAILYSLFVPDSKGNLEDVVLGFDNMEGYEKNVPAFGSFIGRNANRISNAEFTLNGITYQLEKNNGENNLHGGSVGFHKVLYEVECFEEDLVFIEFSRLSKDMEQGFPGNLDLSVTYSLTDQNELLIEYMAVSDKDTIVNLTNHSYFNLSGHKAGSILDHKVWIWADQFTPTTDDLIPTGEIRNVEGTPMDFRVRKSLGRDINENYKPLKQGNGYDHNFVLNKTGNEIEKVAELLDEKSGRKMEVYTDMPGLQLYTGNFLNESKNCKEKARYQKWDGVCFETQYFPDSCNRREFPSCVLKAGEEFNSVTIFKFSNGS